jgi:hypothetical protein
VRKPDFDAGREIVEMLCELREDRVARLARRTKKGRRFAARFVRF